MKQWNEQKMLPKHFLRIGELAITSKPMIIWTVLGSCVSIIMYVPSRRFTAISHAQLPENKKYGIQCMDSCPKPCLYDTQETNRFRYITCSSRYMMEEMRRRGIASHEIETFIYGGAALYNLRFENMSIGEANVKMAEKIVRHFKLKIAAQDVGGNQSRKILFNTETGKTEVRLSTNK